MPIPQDKIVVVTGDPRSGTSLMMQTLGLLGVPIAGEKFPQDRRRQQRLARMLDGPQKDRATAEAARRAQEARDKNPKGFYEIPGVVMRGLRQLDQYGGKAVKIISPGAYPRKTRRGAVGTPTELVHRYILCVRDPRPVAISQSTLARPVRVAGGRGWDNAAWRPSATRYMLENGGLARFLSEQTDKFRSRWLAVDYDAYLASPAATIARVADHLRTSPTGEQIAAAVDNVDASLRRSADQFQAWPDDVKVAGAVAEEVYAALRRLDPVGLVVAAAKVVRQAEILRLENARWYDRSVGLLVTARLARRIAADAALRNRLLTMYRKELRRGMHPQVCAGFDEPVHAEVYTVKRPADMGPLVRRKVRYHGEAMTWEAAFLRHQRLWSQGGAAVDSDRLAGELQRLAATEGGTL